MCYKWKAVSHLCCSVTSLTHGIVTVSVNRLKLSHFRWRSWFAFKQAWVTSTVDSNRAGCHADCVIWFYFSKQDAPPYRPFACHKKCERISWGMFWTSYQVYVRLHHLARSYCGLVFRPLLPLLTPRWADHFDVHFPWSRSEHGQQNGSWCQATYRTTPGGPLPWWASRWTVLMPWQLTWKSKVGEGSCVGGRRRGMGCWGNRTELRYVSGDAEGTTASAISSFTAAIRHWCKLTGCQQACVRNKLCSVSKWVKIMSDAVAEM